jgi:hypothetical protein
MNLWGLMLLPISAQYLVTSSMVGGVKRFRPSLSTLFFSTPLLSVSLGLALGFPWVSRGLSMGFFAGRPPLAPLAHAANKDAFFSLHFNMVRMLPLLAMKPDFSSAATIFDASPA